MNKKFKTTINEINIETSTIMVVEIGNFIFEADERFPWIEVYKNTDGKKEYLESIDEENMPTFINHNDLKVYCLNWFFDNTEVVKGN